MRKLLEDVFSRRKCYLLVGDIMLDSYIFGDVRRVSPEAPVPVLAVERREDRPGGAGNAAVNLAGLNADVTLVGFTGGDAAEKTLRFQFDSVGITLAAVRWERATISKTRLLSGRQQLVRFDEENPLPPKREESAALEAAVRGMDFSEFDGVLLSDYGKGVCSAEVCAAIMEKSRAAGIPVVVDPKGSDWEKYHGALLAAPNVKELGDALGQEMINDDAEIVAAGKILRCRCGLEYLAITRSEKGITLLAEGKGQHFPTEAREVYDVSGAGDTVAACLLRFFTAPMPMKDAVPLANLAAGIVVGFTGTHPINAHLLLERCESSLPSSWEGVRGRGGKVVFTNGCFDILHPGHADYLRKAADLGDYLIVGLNSDASIQRIKGAGRPVNDQQTRKMMLEALSCVNEVVIFEEDTPLELIRRIRPDILVKGGDYKPEDIVGREHAGRTESIPFVEGYSTTELINRIRLQHG
ncbi:MAG: hypothetical protein B0D92_07555 [Spirochaeta sp. LUC14_002_19_P3]|nr:MAG: hypothetical protein B0D92_07555 [Spirochaeta sp. LUC14_002_19_P3]